MKKFFKKYGINLLGSAIMTALLVVLFLILLDVPTAKVYFDNITSRLDKITLFIGAVSAFYVYYDQRSETKRTAYTEIAMEILNIEKTIEDLKRLMYDSKLGNITIYESPAIIQKDIWSQYKYLLLRDLDNEDIQTIDKFYSSASTIESARANIFQSMNNAWTAKAGEEMHGISQIILKYNNSSISLDKLLSHPDMNHELNNYIHTFKSNDELFMADVLTRMIVRELNLYHPISTSATFKKILSNSYLN